MCWDQHNRDVTSYRMTRTWSSPGNSGVKLAASSTSLAMLFLTPVAHEYFEYDPESFSTGATKKMSRWQNTLLTPDCGYGKLILCSLNHFGVDHRQDFL